MTAGVHLQRRRRDPDRDRRRGQRPRRYTYDGGGRLTRPRLPDNTYTTYTYDLADRDCRATATTPPATVLLTTESIDVRRERQRGGDDRRARQHEHVHLRPTGTVVSAAPADQRHRRRSPPLSGTTWRATGPGSPTGAATRSSPRTTPGACPESLIEPATTAHPERRRPHVHHRLRRRRGR